MQNVQAGLRPFQGQDFDLQVSEKMHHSIFILRYDYTTEF